MSTNLVKSHLSDRLSLPVVVKETIPVREIIATPAGETVLDFGQNFAGFPEFDADNRLICQGLFTPGRAALSLSRGGPLLFHTLLTSFDELCKMVLFHGKFAQSAARGRSELSKAAAIP